GGAGVNPPVDDALESSGAVYLYTRTDAGEWSGPVYLKAPVPGAADQFGSAVALSADGRVLAVGARAESGMSSGINPAHDDNAPGAGAVYVYELSGAGVWGEPTYIKAGQVDGGDAFGSDLALSDDGLVLAVSAPHEDGGGAGVDPPPDEMAVFAGAVWMYERTEGGPWGQTAYIKADQPGAGDQFGFSVALSGDGQLLAVGGPSE